MFIRATIVQQNEPHPRSFWESDAGLDDIMLSGRCGVIDLCIEVECGENGRCYPTEGGAPSCYCSPG